MAALTVSFTYLIGELRERRYGLYAVLFYVSHHGVFKSARYHTRYYTAMVTSACFYLVYSADLLVKPKRTWWIFPLLLIGFVFRGPIGLIVPAGVISIYYLLDNRIKQFFMVGLIALMLLLVCTLLLLDLANHVGGAAFMQAVIRMEVLGRLQSSKVPFYFYFIDSFGSYAMAYPCAVLMLVGMRRRLMHYDFLLKLIGWLLIVLIGMSIPGDKKIRYILPMMPAIALLAAYPFIAISQEKYFHYLRQFFITLFLIFPALLWLAAEIVFFNERKFGLRIGIHYLPLMTGFFLLQSGSFWFYYRYMSQAVVRQGAVLFFAAMSLVVAEMMVLEPIELHIDKARAFVVAVEGERVHAHAKLVFYQENPDSMPIKYLINMPRYEKPLFIQSESSLKQYSQPAFFVTSADYFMQLPHALLTGFRIVGNERLGHVQVVVFTNVKNR